MMCFLMKVQMVYVKGLGFEVNGYGSSNVDGIVENAQLDGVDGDGAGATHGNDLFTGAPIEHEPYGMTTEQLAQAQHKFTGYARLRISGIGHLDYSKEHSQAFEDMTAIQIAKELRDEIADSVNYLTFLDIKINRWLKQLEGM
jgi:hypothetical protein